MAMMHFWFSRQHEQRLPGECIGEIGIQGVLRVFNECSSNPTPSGEWPDLEYLGEADFGDARFSARPDPSLFPLKRELPLAQPVRDRRSKRSFANSPKHYASRFRPAFRGPRKSI